MSKISSVANVGDLVRFKAKSRPWSEGWTVIGTQQNGYGVICGVTVQKGNTKREVGLYDHTMDVIVSPPRDTLGDLVDESTIELLERYPNLEIIRRRGTEPPRYMLYCTRCKDVVSVQMTTVESAELIFWYDQVTTAKPQITDGHEMIQCGCASRRYGIEYEPYQG